MLTGYRLNLKLKKVTNDINEYPLDVNNVLVSDSGLPQDTMDTPTDDIRYRVLDEEYCNEEVIPIQTGTCYKANIPTFMLTTETISGPTSLYITIFRPNIGFVSQPYYFFEEESSGSGYIIINFCSEQYPQFKYGDLGNYITPEGIGITTGGNCSNDIDCR